MRFWGPSKYELELDEAVTAVGKPATQFEAVPLCQGERLSVAATKFGGTPYAEAGDAWPMLGDRPYDFVAQLNLRDCDEPPTSAYDLITLYVCWHILVTAEGEFDRACFVRSYKAPSETRAITTLRPQPVTDDYFQVTACTTHLQKVLTYPQPDYELEIPAIVDVARHHAGYQESFE